LTAAPRGADLGGSVEPRSFLGEVAAGVGAVPDLTQRHSGLVRDSGEDFGHAGFGLDEGHPVLATGCGDLALVHGVVDGGLDLRLGGRGRDPRRLSNIRSRIAESTDNGPTAADVGRC
jgi:hypothetical protein